MTPPTDNECYYVLGIETPKVVSNVTKDFLGVNIEYKHLITLSHFGQYPTLEQAKEAQEKSGGVILRGVNV